MAAHELELSLTSKSRYIPWRYVRSWECLACGTCCKRFVAPLTTYEYIMITRHFGHFVVEMSGAKPRLRSLQNGCIFLAEGLCSLQALGMKPLACRLWPFAVREKPLKAYSHERALFEYRGSEYYVYIHSACRGIGKGNPATFRLAIQEAVEISLNPERPLQHLTSPLVKLEALPSWIFKKVGLAGFEPATPGLEGRCSIQLSYRPRPVSA